MELKELNTKPEEFKETVLHFAKTIEKLATDLEPEEEKQFNKEFNKSLKILEPIYIDIEDVKISSKVKQPTITSQIKTRVKYINNIILNANLVPIYEQGIVTDHINIMITDLER